MDGETKGMSAIWTNGRPADSFIRKVQANQVNQTNFRTRIERERGRGWVLGHCCVRQILDSSVKYLIKNETFGQEKPKFICMGQLGTYSIYNTKNQATNTIANYNSNSNK